MSTAAMTFDTLKLADTLEQADIPREQARAIVDVVRKAHDAADVATKGDLREFEHRIDTRFAVVDGRLSVQQWMLTATLAGVGALVAKAFLG